MSRYVVLALVTMVSACDLDLPMPYIVSDLRVLAVRASEPEILFDGAEPASMTFDALVVDPRGGELTYTWRFCPVESDVACNDFPGLRGAAPESSHAALDAMFAETSTGAVASNDAGPVVSFALPSFTVNAPSELVSYHEETSLLTYGAGAWPSAILEVAANDRQLVTQKRLVLNMRDVPNLQTRIANTNPVFDHLELSRGDKAAGDFAPIVEPVVVKPGEALRVRPVFTEESYESYEALRTDVNTREVFVEAVQEDISVQWFITHGEVAEFFTAKNLTKTLDTVFTAPKEVPERGTVTMWLVARDTRGGVSWETVVMQVME